MSELLEDRRVDGQVWKVKAWWLKGDSCICRISHEKILITAFPLEGNPHSRYIKKEDLLERIEGHPMEINKC